jgi:hypothetical protein
MYDNYTNYILAHRMKWNKNVGFGPWNYVPKMDSIPVNRLPIVTNDYNNYKVPGVYEIYYDHTEESTPPQNHTPINYGQLLVFNANNINNNVSQIAIDKYTQDIYFRTFNDAWTNWQRIHPDYTSISLNMNGFITFNNGLILQWTLDGAYAEHVTHMFPIAMRSGFSAWGCSVHKDNPIKAVGLIRYDDDIEISGYIADIYRTNNTDGTAYFICIGCT